MLKLNNNRRRTAVRPTTPIGEAIEQLHDHRMSATALAEFRMPERTDPRQVNRGADRFGFPVEFVS